MVQEKLRIRGRIESSSGAGSKANVSRWHCGLRVRDESIPIEVGTLAPSLDSTLPLSFPIPLALVSRANIDHRHLQFRKFELWAPVVSVPTPTTQFAPQSNRPNAIWSKPCQGSGEGRQMPKLKPVPATQTELSGPSLANLSRLEVQLRGNLQLTSTLRGSRFQPPPLAPCEICRIIAYHRRELVNLVWLVENIDQHSLSGAHRPVHSRDFTCHLERARLRYPRRPHSASSIHS